MARLSSWARLAAFVLAITGFASAARAQNDLFDPVWATMTQPSGGDSPGCRGCHVGPAPAFGRWFGDTREDVLNFFINGDGMILVAGGRQSTLAEALGLVATTNPFMPRDAPLDGRFWVDDAALGLTELTDLGNWLDSIGF